MTCHEQAKILAAMGCSVIPLRPHGKEPLARVLPNGSWADFQNRIASDDEIDEWFRREPQANLGLVCGAVSGVVAVDVDGEDGQAWFKANMPRPNRYQQTSSPHKFHAFYKHPRGDCRIPPAVRIEKEIDVRGDGSYVVIAPSIHPSGAQYSLRELEGFTGIDSLVPVPDLTLDKQKDGSFKVAVSAPEGTGDLHAAQGARNETLTSLCGRMYARGCSADEVVAFAHGWNAQYCEPPLPAKEVETVARSMAKTHGGRNPQAVNAGGVERWVTFAEGDFTIADIYRDLNIKNAEDKETCQASLRELVRRGIIEKCGTKNGWYRRRIVELEELDLTQQEDTTFYPMWLPFGLGKLCRVQPKNIIIVAGETNSGKTGLMFNMVHQNPGYMWRYISSEMTTTEIKTRIEKFGTTIEAFNATCKFFQRVGNYHDAIDPDGFNIIDFLEIYDDFSKVGSAIKQIFDKLDKGIAVIALQKKKGEAFGRGGEFTLEKARLGISLFTHGHLKNGIVGSAKVTKCKNYIPGSNPDGKEVFYILREGYFYETDGGKEMPMLKGNLRYYGEKDRGEYIKAIQQRCRELADMNIADEIVDFYGDVRF